MDVRLAAIRALARLGDASAVPLLLETIAQAQDELAEAARDSLVELKGHEIDDAIAAALDRTDWKARVFFIELAGDRGIQSAAPALLKAADDSDPKIRLAAIRALGTTVGPDDLGTDRRQARCGEGERGDRGAEGRLGQGLPAGPGPRGGCRKGARRHW